jgi:hypothetical protein
MAQPSFLSFGATPHRQDTVNTLLKRIAGGIANGGGGGGSSNNISGAGSPVGVVTPDAVNQFYRDETGDVLWQSTGLTNADWLQWI